MLILPVSLREAVPVWVRVALYSFGGPVGQIAVMHRILVEEKRWIPESRFLHALNFCMLLPGPEAQQLAIYIGWLLGRTAGGLVAGCLFVLPGFLSILGLSLLYVLFQGATPLQAIFFGIKPAVLAIVIEALIRIGKRALRSGVMAAIAAMAFFAIFFLDLPFPLIILAAALLGYVIHRLRPRSSLMPPAPRQGGNGDVPSEADSVIGRGAGELVRPTIGRALRILAVCLALWFGPLAAIALSDGRDNIYIREGLFFSKAAVLTFGGAYAVLAYIAQEAVNVHGWLSPREMLDGLGMAETTPGPLIQVVQFVGFMGAYRNPGSLPPVAAATLGAILTTWVTYVPCFLWIFLGAPYVEILRTKRSLAAALSSITAAVVGVILNLSIWFALHTLFATVDEVRTHGLRLLVPAWRSLDPASALIAVAAMVAMLRFRIGMIPTLLGSAALGLVYRLLLRP